MNLDKLRTALTAADSLLAAVDELVIDSFELQEAKSCAMITQSMLSKTLRREEEIALKVIQINSQLQPLPHILPITTKLATISPERMFQEPK